MYNNHKHTTFIYKGGSLIAIMMMTTMTMLLLMMMIMLMMIRMTVAGANGASAGYISLGSDNSYHYNDNKENYCAWLTWHGADSRGEVALPSDTANT